LVGDFNAYLDWEWPIDLFTHPRDTILFPGNPCAKYFSSYFKRQETRGSAHVGDLHGSDELFQDAVDVVWPEVELMTTFPVRGAAPADNCRPDRVLER
jgi:hypothetical protein